MGKAERRAQTVVLLAWLGLVGSANATLLNRGGGMLYDDVLDITWLSDANLFTWQYQNDNALVSQIIGAVPTLGSHPLAASDFSTTTGRMTWWGAMAWAQALDYGGFRDWRLPTTSATFYPCTGLGGQDEIDCRASEMGYMYYYNLGNISGSDRTGNLTAIGGVLLTGIMDTYWTGLEEGPANAREFFFSAGFNNPDVKTNRLAAWAVRPGDVAAAPEPASLALLGLGLAGLGAIRRKRS